MRYLLIALLIALPQSTFAQYYKHKDEHGNVTFTDQPPPGAEQVEIKPTNTAPPPINSYPKVTQTDSAPVTIEYQIAINSPSNDTIIPRGPGHFSVSASVSPSPQASDQLQLLMDDVPEGEPQKHTTWALTNVFRGTHNIEVAVVNDNGKQLGKSEPVTVYVFRPSSNF